MNLLDETLTSKAKEGPKDITNFSGVNTLSNSFFQLRNLSEISLIPNQSINPALGIFYFLFFFCSFLKRRRITVIIILSFLISHLTLFLVCLYLIIIIGPIGHSLVF